MTLEFHNEAELKTYLVSKGLRKDYVIKPGSKASCALGFSKGYPSQLGDDYLNEQRFEGKVHIGIIDHIVSRKMDNKIIPNLVDPSGVDICNIRFEITNPLTGQVAIYYDIYNWMNEQGKNVFNLNKNTWYVWPDFDEGTWEFNVKQIHRNPVTGKENDLSYLKGGQTQRVAVMKFDGIAAKYPR